MEFEKIRVKVKVDQSTIDRGDFQLVREPVFWSVDIYEGPEKYEKSLKPFTRPQRLLNAVEWYFSETGNGGHDQFYWNSTGIVWPDALAGLEAMKMLDAAAILRESTELFGEKPSLDRSIREEQLEKFTPDFDELDTRLFEILNSPFVNSKIEEFIRQNARDFYFEGELEKLVRRNKV